MANSDYASLLNRAAAYCSQAERAPLEVEQKLRGWEAQEEDIERIMQYLNMLLTQRKERPCKD